MTPFLKSSVLSDNDLTVTMLLDNAVLGNDLDCQNCDLRNIALMLPPPTNLVGIDDPRLSGAREVPDGSVTNDSVNATAGIAQSKLNLDGVIPADWLATGPLSFASDRKAAQGDLVEHVANRGASDGYAALDADGKVVSVVFDDGPATGSVNSVGMTVPDPLFITGSPITGSGTFHVNWKQCPHNAWFGSDGTLDFQHHEFIYPFYVTDHIEGGLLGGQPCSKFTTGTFARARLPEVKHGAIHNRGVLPAPGATGPTMYFGRDTLWHHFVVNDPALVYQPGMENPTITLDWWEIRKAHITIRCLTKGANLFYRVTAEGHVQGAFKEVLHDDTPDDPHITLQVNEHDFIEAYAAKPGYTNSDIEEWEVITPITDLELS